MLPTSSRASSQPSTPALSPARGVTFGETELVTTEEIEGVLPSGNVYLLSDEGCVMSVVDNDTRSIWASADNTTSWSCEDDDIEWSPWTRRQFHKRDEPATLWDRPLWTWAPDEIGWWIGFHFLVGSCFFAIGAFASLFVVIEDSPIARRKYHMCMYFLGQIEFTCGSVLLMYSAMYSPLLVLSDDDVFDFVRGNKGDNIREDQEVYQHNRSSNFLGNSSWNIRRAVGESGLDTGLVDINQPLLTSTRSTAAEAVETYQAAVAESHLQFKLKPKWTNKRYWLDGSGAVVLLVGVNLYTVMIFAEVASTWTPLGEDLERWLVTWPCNAGGVCFVAAAYLLWVSTHLSWSLLIWRPTKITYWISLTNLVGSLCFLFGGAITHPFFREHSLVPNFLELFIGYFFGALIFAAQSYLIILEVALAKYQASPVSTFGIA